MFIYSLKVHIFIDEFSVLISFSNLDLTIRSYSDKYNYKLLFKYPIRKAEDENDWYLQIVGQ